MIYFSKGVEIDEANRVYEWFLYGLAEYVLCFRHS